MAEQELYLRVKLGLPSSDEAKILERHLGDRRAWSYTLEMWDWFATKHPEGQLTGPDAAYLIARGSGWEGDPDKFCAAQVLAGFLAPVTEGYRARGWEKWAGFYFTVKAKAAAKKAGQRAAAAAKSPACPPVCPGDVPGTSRGQGQEKAASKGDVPGDPSPISSFSSSASEGVQGEVAGAALDRERGGDQAATPNPRDSGGAGRVDAKPASAPRARLVSPYGAADPHPLTTAVLAALYERGHDAAAPSEKQAARVEAAIKAAGLADAIDRLEAVYSDPDAKKPLTYHVGAIRGEGPRPSAHGDLGAELHPWPSRLTDEEKRQARAELAALHPDLAGAPIGCTGVPGEHPVEAIAALNARWRAVAEARS